MDDKLKTFGSDQEAKPSGFQQFAKQGVFLAVGAVASYAFFQWQNQQDELTRLSQMVAQMQEQSEAEVISRNASLDLVAIGTANAAVPAAPAVEPVVEVAPAVAAPAPEVVEASLTQPELDADHGASRVPESAADRLRVLVDMTANNVEESTLEKDARRLETLAIVHAGVQELVAAVVEGNYDIHTDYEDDYFSGRIHFAFVGHEEDQVELEQFLAAAAEEGIIAHSSSVVDGDGRVNGHVLLFDLVERALENGTIAEQRAGQKMRAEAVAMLAADAPAVAATTTNSSGQRTYVVEPGDSLAYIALQFYGNTQDFARIYDANRGQLSSPERINVGQRLVIPEA